MLNSFLHRKCDESAKKISTSLKVWIAGGGKYTIHHGTIGSGGKDALEVRRNKLLPTNFCYNIYAMRPILSGAHTSFNIVCWQKKKKKKLSHFFLVHSTSSHCALADAVFKRTTPRFACIRHNAVLGDVLRIIWGQNKRNVVLWLHDLIRTTYFTVCSFASKNVFCALKSLPIITSYFSHGPNFTRIFMLQNSTQFSPNADNSTTREVQNFFTILLRENMNVMHMEGEILWLKHDNETVKVKKFHEYWRLEKAINYVLMTLTSPSCHLRIRLETQKFY